MSDSEDDSGDDCDARRFAYLRKKYPGTARGWLPEYFKRLLLRPPRPSGPTNQNVELINGRFYAQLCDYRQKQTHQSDVRYRVSPQILDWQDALRKCDDPETAAYCQSKLDELQARLDVLPVLDPFKWEDAMECRWMQLQLRQQVFYQVLQEWAWWLLACPDRDVVIGEAAELAVAGAAYAAGRDMPFEVLVDAFQRGWLAGVKVNAAQYIGDPRLDDIPRLDGTFHLEDYLFGMTEIDYEYLV